MTKEQVMFLLGGFAFGVLVGYALFTVAGHQPGLQADGGQAQIASGPMGPSAPTQVGSQGNEGSAPMMQEINQLKARLQDDPEDFGVLVRLGGIYFDVGMWDQAATYYERAVEVRPDDPNLLTDLGTSYRGMRQYDKAIDMFRKAGEIDSGHWQSRFNFAVVAGIDLGQYDIAMKMVESLEQLDPPPPRIGELRKALEQAQAESRGASGASG